MSDQQKHIRRGRRRQDCQDDDFQDPVVVPTFFLNSDTDASRKKWTRSLSPHRSFNPAHNNNPSSTDDVAIKSHFSESFSHSIVTPVLNSFKRFSGRNARSQSPGRRDILEADSPFDVYNISSRTEKVNPQQKQDFDQKTPAIRSERNSSSPALSTPHDIHPPEHSTLQKETKKTLMPPSLADNRNKHRSKSPRRPENQRNNDVVATGDRKSTIKPPSGRDLMKEYSEKHEKETDIIENMNQRKLSNKSQPKDKVEERPPKQKPRPNTNADPPRSSKSLGRPKSRRKLASEGERSNATQDTHNPSSARTLTKQPIRKPSSDPDIAKRIGDPAHRTHSSTNVSSTIVQGKPSSVNALASSSNHKKPSSDPGRSSGAQATTMAVDRIPRPTQVINRPNLTKESLQHVAEVKESLRQMRTQQYSQRHKVKFDNNSEKIYKVPKSKSTPPATIAAAAIAANLHESHGSLDSQNATSTARLQGITMDDLEVGHLRTPIGKRQTLKIKSPLRERPQQESTRRLSNEHEENVQALKKSIQKSKKLVKRCCRDVWTERDEIIYLQRTNWSIRKALLQTNAPADTVTTLNMKLEKALREERQITAELEQYQEEKHQIELECSQMAKVIEEFKDLLDALNTQVVPLFPLDESQVEEEGFYLLEGTEAAKAVINLLDDDDFSDSIHSTDG
ncbi:hypothetical protein IV203_023400 [Nitzschia inconspicua]|uniref:Uncharacterized protein n=1 Tax=Nitzschia inconspicua TaxID=303405 RepID=A0A9K3KEB8_9STRA|nr:hypothetical protein IV203_023400 [Nitzschia inconspicua]